MLGILVVDAAPIINNCLPDAQQLITIEEVIAEIKDKNAQVTLSKLEIQTKAPAQQFINKVIAFAKKTGDYQALSFTDIKVIALCLQLEIELNGCSHIRSNPLPAVLSSGRKTSKSQQSKPIEQAQNHPIKVSLEEQHPLESQLSSLSVSTLNVNENDKQENDENSSQIQSQGKNQISAKSDDIEDDSSSDGGEWITPETHKAQMQSMQNLSLYNHKSLQKDDQNQKSVSVITTDFAMQNVILQMNLNLVAPSGMRVKSLKKWVMRCHACYKVTGEMDKLFCPTCGNATLLKTSCKVDKHGKLIIFLKKNFQYNNRGTQYSIPNVPQSRFAKPLILREDQKEFEKAQKLKMRIEKKALNESYDDIDDLISRNGAGSHFGGGGKIVVGYGRKNINNARKSKQKRR